MINNKVVILAGGKGSRISEESKIKPKPMILINGKPIILYIINLYIYHGFTNFIIAAGYKKNILKRYFKKKKLKKNIKIEIINTGINTMTAGRILKLKKKLINEKNFLLTYGDGIADVNIKKLYKFHSKNNSICTLTAVKPKSRFGVLKFRTNNKIFDFNEKPKNDFKNGGFMIFSNKIFKYIKNDKSILEKDVLPRLAKKNLLSGYKHLGFWECIDTMKDKIEVTKSIKMKKFIWLKK